MSHHEERLAADLGAIRACLETVSAEVMQAVQNAVQVLLTGDRDLAARTILGDMHINRSTREVDRRCHAFVARHFPSAGVLRFISSALRMDVALERVGDYAATICRETLQLKEPLSQTIIRDVEMMSDLSLQLLEAGLRSFNQEDAELAHRTIALAAHTKNQFNKALRDLIDEGQQGRRPIRDLFELLLIFIRFERVRAQAKNICEETVFCVEGKTKQPKNYRILFLDRKNDGRSQLAEAFARKAYPESGVYSSAGFEPAEKLDPRFVDFMDRHGLSLGAAVPIRFDPRPSVLEQFHVIVGLEAGALEQIGELPYSTIFLNWEGEPIGDCSDESLEAAYKQLTPRVRDLIEALRGEGAS